MRISVHGAVPGREGDVSVRALGRIAHQRKVQHTSAAPIQHAGQGAPLRPCAPRVCNHREHRHHISLIPLPESLNSPWWPPALSHTHAPITQHKKLNAQGAFDANIDRCRRRGGGAGGGGADRPRTLIALGTQGRPSSAEAAAGGAGVAARCEFFLWRRRSACRGAAVRSSSHSIN